MKKKVGFIGWRGMVGHTLRARMEEEKDFLLMDPYFFSTSQVGLQSPSLEGSSPDQTEKKLQDAYDLEKLSDMDILVSTQGGSYTEKIHPLLRDQGWQGFWIDAASTLRMSDQSIIALDPINRKMIEHAIQRGVKDFVGSNCSVAIAMMAIGGLLIQKEVDWISLMTYQAVSGAGIKAMEELLDQASYLIDAKKSFPKEIHMLSQENKLNQSMNDASFPVDSIGYPLMGNLLPWIDRPMENGQSKEEWKSMVEMNKILGNSTDQSIPMDGTCVRVGVLRCHSMGFTIKLKRNLSLPQIEQIIEQQNQWVKIVPNQKETTLKELTPARISGQLTIAVGRIRKMNLGPTYLNGFAVGDQLLWGAAEPLRRVLRMILDY